MARCGRTDRRAARATGRPRGRPSYNPATFNALRSRALGHDHRRCSARSRCEEIGHGGGEAGVRQVVHAVRERGVEAAPVLVVAAGAGLEAGEAALDAVLDTLVVADREVQIAHLAKASPVAAVEDAGLLHVDGAGDDLAALPRGDEAEVALPALAQLVEEAARSGTGGPSTASRWSTGRCGTSARRGRRRSPRPRAP